jgi:Protein phosphatase 2C
MPWKVFCASAAGRYHLESGAPCQDAGHYARVDGAWVGVVCDGAGSAAQGSRGAEFVARALAEGIARSLDEGALRASDPRDWIVPLQAQIAQTRGELETIAQVAGAPLRDYATTLVGCVVRGAQGCTFHVGDGFALLRTPGGHRVLSAPENGEFADQTYFLSDESWQEHLRLVPFEGAVAGSIIGLMSDGAAPFVVNRARSGFFEPFIDPVSAFLARAQEHDGNAALKKLLEDEKTLAITGDDKTLLLALAA